MRVTPLRKARRSIHRDRTHPRNARRLFGVLAITIAGLGVFGLLAFQVARRTQELGVRIALGATRQAILQLVLGDVVWIVVFGLAIGGAAALTLTGLARRFLFGLTPTDPGVFVVAGLVLGLTAALGAWLPARRASHIDPLAALRHE